MKRLILLIPLLLMLGGCGWQFAAFEYDTVIESQPMAVGSITPPAIDSEGNPVDTALTTPIGPLAASIPTMDILSAILTQPTVDAAKVLAICVAGDPGSIAAWRINANQFSRVTVRKRVFVIKTKDSK